MQHQFLHDTIPSRLPDFKKEWMFIYESINSYQTRNHKDI